MADIVLKDGSGSAGEYSDVKHIEVDGVSGDSTTFTDMENIKCYYGKQNVVGDGKYTYTITGQWFCVVGAGYAMATVSDALCKDWGELTETGDYSLIIILTTKTLKKGETYSTSDLYRG